MFRNTFFQLLAFTILISCGTPGNQSASAEVETADSSGFVSVIINFGDEEKAFLDIPMDSTMSVYQLLSKLGSESSDFQMMDTLYGDLGHLVLGFNGVTNESPKYWVYCLNASKANKGVDQMMIKSGDEISWYYTSEMKPCHDKKKQ